MRNPSIHITKDTFLKILGELSIEDFPTDKFFALARRASVNTRTVVVSNKKDTKTVNKVLLASKGDAAMVADIIYATRIKLKHRGIRKINESMKKDWTLCKELASICNQFVQDFQFLDTRAGFIEYINIGFKRMGKDHRNILNRLIAMAENIFTYYDTQQSISEDDSPKLTLSIYDYYNQKVADATGIWERSPLKEDPEKYNHFLSIRKLCESNQWDHRDFIDAQFEGMAWCNGLPEPHNMYGPKAIERYKKYVYKYGSSQPKIQGSLWDQIK